jgi:hypothetical protein
VSSEESVDVGQSKETPNKGKVIVIVLALMIVTGGGGFYYYSGIQTAKSSFAAKCITLVPKLSENFQDYKNSSYKPGLFDDVVSSPSTYLSSLKSSLGGLRAAAEENSRYSGAKETVKALDAYNANLGEYQKIKQRELSLENNNPHLSKLRAWTVIAKSNVYRTLVDENYNRALMRVGEQYDDLWDEYMDKNFTAKDTRDLIESAKKVDAEFTNLANLCRGARG